MTDKSNAEKYQDHPLTGLGLKPLLTQLVDHYNWDILAEQININCFRSNPSIPSSVKFLRRTDWAREKVEAFYLYKFLQYPRPSEAQHKLPPRERELDHPPLHDSPTVIELGQGEFFDDPITGPSFPSKAKVTATRKKKKDRAISQTTSEDKRRSQPKGTPSSNANETASKDDPWAKWKT